MVITKIYNTFVLQIEANRLFRRIEIFQQGFQSESVTVRQSSDDGLEFTSAPIISCDKIGASVAEARRFAQTIEAAAQIAADIESWIEE